MVELTRISETPAVGKDAVEDDRVIFPGGARAIRISHKPIYPVLGIENVRHRRKSRNSIILRRLLSLDYVLEHPEIPWLPTEQEKVNFFEWLCCKLGRRGW